METIKKSMLSFVVLLFSLALMAQETDEIEMAEQMMASGKIYVVIAVLLLIFLGIVIYLISLDRKIGKLEKEVDNKG
jgi:CcmD family protein